MWLTAAKQKIKCISCNQYVWYFNCGEDSTIFTNPHQNEVHECHAMRFPTTITIIIGYIPYYSLQNNVFCDCFFEFSAFVLEN